MATLLSIEECMNAVEQAFRLYGEGKALPPKVLGLHTEGGGFHIKAGMLNLNRNYFVAKLNANFPDNPKKLGLPTIQGVVIVCDADNGRLLAVMDSIEITIVRTGAATGVATKYLAQQRASVATICGCGNQGSISLSAILKVRDIKKVYAFDIEDAQTEKFRKKFEGQVEVVPIGLNDLSKSLQLSQIIVTCTTATKPFVEMNDVRPGTFIAAVGADNEHKQELTEDLVASSKIITDITDQSATIGELHHAIKAGLSSINNVHAELGEVIAGSKTGRETEDEIIIFDSTGTALQDVAAAAIIYEKALVNQIGIDLDFGSTTNSVMNGRSEKQIRDLKSWFPFH